MLKVLQKYLLSLPGTARSACPRPLDRIAPRRTLKGWSASRSLVALGVVVCTVLALSDFMSAQRYVFSSASFPTGLRPIFVATGDYNGDGIQDVVVVNQCGSDPTCLSGGSVSVLLGKPDGTLHSHVDYPVGTDPMFAVVGDFNNDGKPDIAVTSGSNTVSVLLGIGDGTFQTPVVYNTASAPGSAVIGDFNHDGRLDLAVACSGSKSISVLLGNGDGTFQPHADYAVNFTPQSIAAADFNGDGKVDLAVADLDVTILLGNGDGTFQAAVDYPGNGATFVVAGDWNGDGKIDVAATSGFGDTITVLNGKGDGTLQIPYTSYEVGGNPISMAVADLNGDGHPDLVVGSGTGAAGPNQSATISVLLNKGDGTFQLHGNFGGMVTLSLAAADFNGDGLADIAVPDPDFNTVNITLGDGHGALGSIFDVPSPPSLPTTEVLARDFNGDGKLDLAMSLQGSGSIAVALGNGDGTFQSPIVNTQPGATPRIAAADFNGDGKLDLAEFIYSVLNNVQILLGKGDGTFQTGSSIAVSNIPGEIVSGDFNGDGKMDLATVGFGIVILLGNGDGTFQTPISFPTRNSNAALASDFNKDGKLDLAILSPDFTTLTVFLGNGDGTFQAGTDYATGNGPVGLASADVNHDGSLDLAVVNAGSDTVSVFLGNGDGTFQNKVDFATVQGPRSVAVADVDGDGHPDLMVTGNGISVLFGKGDGTFSPHQDYFSAIDMGPVIAADLDGDGQSDLAVVSLFAATTSVFLNRSAIALRPNQLNFPALLVGTSSTPQSVTLYNPGIFPLRVQGISMAGDFSQTNTCGSSVAVATSCTVTVTFTPTSGGPRSGTATISDNAPGGKRSISLAGNAMDFSLAAATGANCPSGGNCSSSATVSAGQSATYDLQVTPFGGFNGSVALSCGGGPSSTTCAVSPATVPPSGSSSYAFAVTVTNNSRTAAIVSEPSSIVALRIALLSWTVSAVLFVWVATVGHALKRRPVRVFLFLSLGLLAACGGNKITVPPTHATINVNASSGGQNRTLQLSLTINH